MILGMYCGHIGIMENRIETAIEGLGFRVAKGILRINVEH